jgi:hypothetical protein
MAAQLTAKQSAIQSASYNTELVSHVLRITPPFLLLSVGNRALGPIDNLTKHGLTGAVSFAESANHRRRDIEIGQLPSGYHSIVQIAMNESATRTGLGVDSKRVDDSTREKAPNDFSGRTPLGGANRTSDRSVCVEPESIPDKRFSIRQIQ